MHRPKSTTACQESEMANKCLRQLQSNPGGPADPVDRLRLLCLSRGGSGILVLGRLFRKLEQDGHKRLNLDQFYTCLKSIGLEISVDEAKEMFNKFDTYENDTVDVEELFVQIRPHLSDTRKNVLDKAFHKLDRNGVGEITADDINHVYNVKSQTRYISGEESEEAILKSFMDIFEHDHIKDGTINKEEFLNYYSAISASVDNDCYFDLMIRQAYKL